MWSFLLLILCVVGIAIELGWKDGNWGCLTAIGFFFVLGLLCYAGVPRWAIMCLCLGIPILVIVWGCKSDKANGSSRPFQAQFNKDLEDYKQFVTKYSAPSELEREAQIAAYSNSSERCRIIERLEEEMDIPVKIITPDMVFHALLAEHGKLSKNVAQGGFAVLPGMTDKDETTTYRSFISWMNEELIKNGLPYEIKFVSWKNKNAAKAGIENDTESDATWTVYQSGYYYWRPIRRFLSGFSIDVSRKRNLYPIG